MFETFSCSASDGLLLGGRQYGVENKDATPIVCLSGITRNCLDFHNLALHLSSERGGHRRVLALDYRGRGYSEYDENWHNYNIFTEAEDCIAAMTAAGFGHVNIIGSSRGGLIAMLLAVMRPGILRSVILNDIGPVIEGQGLVRIRNALEKHRHPKTWEDAEASFVRFGRLQFPSLSERQWREEAGRIFQQENGKVIPRYDTKILKTLKDINFDVRLADMWPQFAALTKIPLMTIRGEHSDILSLETLEIMQTFHPDMQVEHVKGQGHSPRLGTAGLPEIISQFLKNK